MVQLNNKTKYEAKAVFDTATSTKHHGVLLLKQSTLQTIYDNSGSAAVGNEFQAHYSAIVFRHVFEDDSILDVAIPTVFYNYTQAVTGGHVSFTLKDVKTMSTKVRPVHDSMVSTLLTQGLQAQVEEIFGLSFTPSTSTVNSIHRHPGSSARQGFSGTDLDRTIEEPGVVYPLVTGNNTPNFASIMAVDSGRCNLAHTEYRLVTTDGTQTTYTEARAHSISVVKVDISEVEKSLGVPDMTTEVRGSNSAVSRDITEKLSTLAYSLPSPHMLINPANVTKAVSVPYEASQLAKYGRTQSFDFGPSFEFPSPFGDDYWGKPTVNTPSKPAKVYHKPLVMMPAKELKNCTKARLLEIISDVDEFFGLRPSDYGTYNDAELLEAVQEGYQEVADELAEEEWDRTIKQEELIALGAPKETVVLLSSEKLDQLHAQAYPE